jgi:hypothetical protein
LKSNLCQHSQSYFEGVAEPVNFLPGCERRRKVIAEWVDHLIHHVALLPGQAQDAHGTALEVINLLLVSLMIKCLRVVVFLVSPQMCLHPIIICRLFYLELEEHSLLEFSQGHNQEHHPEQLF